MLNQTILIGRITDDVKTKKDDNGKESCKITLAVQRSYKDENGIYNTDFVPVLLCGGIATNAAEYCRKGDLVGVKGRIETECNGVVIIADKLTFLSSRNPKEEE